MGLSVREPHRDKRLIEITIEERVNDGIEIRHLVPVGGLERSAVSGEYQKGIAVFRYELI